MVHGILSGHGGTIRVYSEPGKGTAFHLYFPAAEAPAVDAPATVNGFQQGGNQHILYVDDDEGLVFLGTRMLKRLGYRVTGYSDANIALAEFRARPHEFDFVVSDLSMPRMSGLEFAEQILAIRPDIPVVISTGYIRPEDQERAHAIGVYKLIQKPHSMEQLQQTFAEVFARTPETVKQAP